MARITSCLVPLINAADGLTEQARDVLQLYRHELERSFPAVMTHLEAAIEALAEASDALEQS